MKFDKDFNLDAFLDALEHAAVEEVVFNSNPDWSYRKTTKKVVKTITTTTSELIEDDQLVKDLVEFCKDSYCWCCRDVREKDVRGLLIRKYHILNLSKYAEPGSEYRFVMDYPDIYNYRYEGDYNPHAEPTIRRYSFSDVLDEFVELHPDKCHWETKVETKTIEED
jgi:hypothetical protein